MQKDILQKFLENFIGDDVANYKVINYEKENDNVLFHHNLISHKMPLFMCKIEHDFLMPMKKAKDNKFLDELLAIYPNNILCMNYRMYYDYDGKYPFSRDEFIQELLSLVEKNKRYDTLLEIVKLRYNSKNKLMAYDYQQGSFRLLYELYPNIDEEEIEDFLSDFDMIDEDDCARFYLNLSNFKIYGISEDEYDEDYVISLTDHVWEVCDLSEDMDVELLDLFIHFRNIYQIKQNIFEDEETKMAKITLDDISTIQIFDNTCKTLLQNKDYAISNFVIIDKRNNKNVCNDDDLMDYVKEHIEFQHNKAYFFDKEDFDEDDYEYKDIMQILQNHPMELLFLLKLIGMEDDEKENYTIKDIRNLICKIHENGNYIIYIDAMKYYFDNANKKLYLHINIDDNYISYNYDETLYENYDFDDVSHYSQIYMLGQEKFLETSIDKLAKKNDVSYYETYETILLDPFVSAFIIPLWDDEKPILIDTLMLEDELNVFANITKSIRVEEVVVSDESVRIGTTRTQDEYYEEKKAREELNRESMFPISDEQQTMVETNDTRLINNVSGYTLLDREKNDDFVNSHKRRDFSLFGEDNGISGQHIGENKSMHRDIEKKIDIYNYDDDFDKPKGFFQKIASAFRK